MRSKTAMRYIRVLACLLACLLRHDMATYGTAFCDFEFLLFIYLIFFFVFKKTSDYHACTDICYLFIPTLIAGVSKSLQRGVTRVIGVYQWNVTMSIGIGITIAHKGTGKGGGFL